MNNIDYYKEAKKIRIKYESLLLSELLYLSYKYNKCQDHKTNVEKIYNECKNMISYSDEEKNKIIKQSLVYLENKYNIFSDISGNLIGRNQV